MKEKWWLLLVDDNLEFVDSLKELIELHFDNKVKIVTAFDGIDAMNKVNYQEFDCIISDINLPRRNGEILTQLIRKSRLNCKTPVILVSGKLKTDLNNKLEYVYFIEKPIENNNFIEKLKAIIKLKCGKKKQVSALMLNLLIESVKYSFNNLLGTDEYSILAPVSKKQGEPVHSHKTFKFQFKTHENQSTFYLIVCSRAYGRLNEKLKDKGKSYSIGTVILGKIAESSSYKKFRHLSVEEVIDHNEVLRLNGVVLPFKFKNEEEVTILAVS